MRGPSLLVPRPEVRGLVVLASAALDLFFLGEETLELRIGFLDERGRLLGGFGGIYRTLGRGGRTLDRSGGLALSTGLALLGLATAATGGEHAAGTGLARRLADRHG